MSIFDYERRKWDDEVDTEAARLVREGTPPLEAGRIASQIVATRRRRQHQPISSLDDLIRK